MHCGETWTFSWRLLEKQISSCCASSLATAVGVKTGQWDQTNDNSNSFHFDKNCIVCLSVIFFIIFFCQNNMSSENCILVTGFSGLLKVYQGCTDHLKMIYLSLGKVSLVSHPSHATGCQAPDVKCGTAAEERNLCPHSDMTHDPSDLALDPISQRARLSGKKQTNIKLSLWAITVLIVYCLLKISTNFKKSNRKVENVFRFLCFFKLMVVIKR